MIKSFNCLVFKNVLILVVLFLFSSCEDDFNTIGTDIIGADDFSITKEEIDLSANNQNLGPVQSNNLPTNPLGIFTNSSSETITANFVTQVELASVNPKIDLDLKPVVDSVVLSVPYFNTKTKYKDDGVTGEYDLDSIYGGKEAKLKLSIYESGYFLRDINPVTQDKQVYFSNQDADIDAVKKTLLNDSSSKSENEEFVFSNEEVKELSINSSKVKSLNRSAPQMRIKLNNNFFYNKFFTAASSGNLTTNNDFKNYFRGLYFKVENSGSAETNLAMMNFKGGKITVYYHQNTSATKTDVENKTLVMNLTGNSVSLLKNSNIKPVDSKNLKLKGGEGSMVILDIFNPEDADGNGVSDELDNLRANKTLITDATLTVFIDKEAMSNETNLPNRLYLYDLDNNKALLDYTFDSSVRPYRKYDKYLHGGIIDDSNNSYKIKLTYHIRNLIKDESAKNVRLGLVISENINDVSNKTLKNPININSKVISEVPTSSIMSPFETIIYGNSEEVSSDKRLKLEISYTKPN